MRIGCLQFAPHVGDIDNNLNRADAVLNRADPDGLDLLVLPELAFSGYNFKSLQEIFPYLEPSGSGISSLWARTVALKYDATVVVGYPEKVDVSHKWPTGPEHYNSAIVVNGEGETVANYRKAHLFMTDETWALEGGSGFFGGWLTGLGQTAIGICMDLNPYRFEAPWNAYEFAFHVLEIDANLVILSMAWLTRDDARQFSRMPQEPDMDTLMYWVTRLEPLIRSDNEDEIIVVFANRAGVEKDAVYAGTSAVLGIKEGEVRVYGVLGRGDKELLVVDTEAPPYARLVYRPEGSQLKAVPGPSSRTGPRTETSTKDHSQRKDGSGSATTEHPKRKKGSRESQADNSDRSAPSVSSRSTTSRASSNSRHSRNRSRSISRNKDNATKITRPQSARKLSLKTDKQTLGEYRNHSPPIRTPTCPSPTPISLRPRLTIPPADSLTARYLGEQEATPHPLTMRKVNHTTSKVVQPKAAAPYPTDLMSARDKPQVYGGSVKIGEDGTTPSTASSAAITHFSDASPISPKLYWIPSAKFLETPFDIRGRTPAAESDMTAFSEIESPVSRNDSNPSAARQSSQQTKVNGQTARARTPLDDLSKQEKRARPKAQPSSSTQEDALPDRPSSPKSRNTSRSRGPERPGSAMDASTDLSIIALKLDEISRRVDTPNGRNTPDNRRQDLHQAPPTERTSSTPAQRQRSSSNNWSGRLPDLLGSRSTDSSQGVQNDQIRAARRGRQRPSEHSSPDTPGEVRQSSKQRQVEGSKVEAIDFSQFKLIEEYPSPYCPVHSRTSSQTRETQNATSHGDNKNSNTSRSNKLLFSRFHDSLESSWPSLPRAHSSAPISRQEEPILQPIAPPVVRSKTTINTTFPDSKKPTSSPKIEFEPKTPRAMMLISDGMFKAPIMDPSLKCVERMAVKETGIPRPKSAVW